MAGVLRSLASLGGRAFPELRPPLTSFGRLAVTHLLMVTGDAFVTVALAGSLFFSISPDAARGKVALYLLLTIAPFALVAPVLGPLLDRSRGARRAMVMASGAARVVLCFFMARDLHSLLLFPEAFLILVASKLYLVGKAALVPAVVGDGPELVGANSRLALISALAGLAGGAPAVAILKIPHLGGPWVLRVDAVILVFATLSAARLPRPDPVRIPTPDQYAQARAAGTQAAEDLGRKGSSSEGPAGVGLAPILRLVRPGREERDEDTAEIPALAAAPKGALNHAPPQVWVAATAMAVLRLTVGLVTFLMAFELRRQHAATWWYGVILGASVAGSLVATLVTPRLRRTLREESILLTALVAVAVTSLLSYLERGRLGDCILTAGVGLAAASAKLGFDSMVQRDVRESSRGRAFAAFETRFQLAWVIGGLVPVAVAFSDRVGEVLVGVLSAGAGFLYLTGRPLLAGRRSTTTVRANLSWRPWRKGSQSIQR
jgi:hypothetical protein